MLPITECGISGTNNFHSLWKLPALPLTERFGTFAPGIPLAFDQELLISHPTGHVQLRYQIDPKILYSSSDYFFRTSNSSTSRKSVEFFLSYLNEYRQDHIFKSAVDVGGNDLFVARGLIELSMNTSVVDPICSELDGRMIDGINVIGKFVEDIDFSSDLPRADLVVCRHTIEHISNPRELIDQWFQQCDPECLYVVEVPCYENLNEAMRFDAIFHQHYHYFDLTAFKQLIWECGGEYLSHIFNHQGSCGGALIIIFRRAKTIQLKPYIDINSRIERFERRIAQYKLHMEIMGELLVALPKPVFGYGASLMLSTLGYHLNTDFSELDCLLDDDPSRDGATYENIPVTVRHTALVKPPPNSSYLITSLENIRPIYRRIQELSPRRILVPFIN